MILFLYYVKCSENQCSENIIGKYHECYQKEHLTIMLDYWILSGKACHGKK